MKSNMHTISKVSFTTALCALIFLVPQIVGASSLSIDQKNDGSGKGIVTVSLNAEDESINVVEGTIVFPKTVSISSVSTGGSALLLWPDLPHVVLADHTIVFTGGTNGSLKKNTKSTMFSFYVTSQSPTSVTLTTKKVATYAADGVGTKQVLADQQFLISATPESSAISSQVPADSKPPTIVTELGKDDSLFEGKYFVSFYGSDEGAGIEKFLVKEGNAGSYHPVQNFYVLQDQSRKTPVWIKAVDAVGNSVEVRVKDTGQNTAPWILIVLALVFAAVCSYFILKRMRGNRT